MNELAHMARTIKGVWFPYPVLVGGGIVKTHEHVRRLATTDVIAEWGSIETEPSLGNGGRDYYAHYLEVKGGIRTLEFTQNRLGIPNPGMAYVEQHASDLIKLYEDCGKPLVINISGKSIEDLVQLLKRAIICGFKVIIVNGACPNKDGQPVLCNEQEPTDEFFERVEKEIGPTNVLIIWKVSCGMSRKALTHNRQRVADSSVFGGIATGNTVPNTYYLYDGGLTSIYTAKDKSTRAGLAGPAILPIALDHTEFCAQAMPKHKIVYGLGGVTTPMDAMRFIRSGATLVGMVSAFREAKENPDFVRDFLEDLRPLLAA